MSLKIFVNLPSHDLEASKAFYVALGARIEEKFTDENAACIVWNDDIYFMALTTNFLQTFTTKSIIDPREGAQALTALMVDSREDVDAKVEAGLAAGGTETKDPQDYGFMYQRQIEDPSGNILEFGYMDPHAAEVGPEAYMTEQFAAENA